MHIQFEYSKIYLCKIEIKVKPIFTIKNIEQIQIKNIYKLISKVQNKLIKNSYILN